MTFIDGSTLVPIISEYIWAQAAPAPSQPQASSGSSAAVTSGASASSAPAPVCPIVAPPIESLEHATERFMFMVMLLSVRYMSEVKLVTWDTATPKWDRISVPKLKELIKNIATLRTDLKQWLDKARRERDTETLREYAWLIGTELDKRKIPKASAYYFASVFKPLADVLIGKDLVTDPTSSTKITEKLNQLSAKINDAAITGFLRRSSDMKLEENLAKRLLELYRNPRLSKKKKKAVRSMMFMVMLLSVRYMSEVKLVTWDTATPKWDRISVPKLKEVIKNIATLRTDLKQWLDKARRDRDTETLREYAWLIGTELDKRKIPKASAYYFASVFKPLADVLIGKDLVTDPTSSTKIMQKLNTLRQTFPAAIQQLLNPLFRDAATNVRFEERLAKKLVGIKQPAELQKYAFKIDQVNPGSPKAKPGDKVTLTITGKNLDQAAKIQVVKQEVRSGNVQITETVVPERSIKRTLRRNNRELIIEFTIPQDAKPGTYAINLVNAANNRNITLACLSLTVEKKGKKKKKKKTWLQKLAAGAKWMREVFYSHGRDGNLKFNLVFGDSNYARKNYPLGVRSFAETGTGANNFFGINGTFGPAVFTFKYWDLVLRSATLKYYGGFHNNAKNTNLFELGANPVFRIKLKSDWFFDIDPTFNYQYSDFRFPVMHRFFNGHDLNAAIGAAVGWGESKYFALRGFAKYVVEQAWIKEFMYPGGTVKHPINRTAHAAEVGVDMDMRASRFRWTESKKPDRNWMPDIRLNISALVGKDAVPGAVINDPSDPRPQFGTQDRMLWGIKVGASAQFPNLSVPWGVGFSLRHHAVKDWNPITMVEGRGNITFRGIAELDARVIYSRGGVLNNLTFFPFLQGTGCSGALQAFLGIRLNLENKYARLLNAARVEGGVTSFLNQKGPIKLNSIRQFNFMLDPVLLFYNISRLAE